MTSTNWDVAQDIGLINCDIRFNIACVSILLQQMGRSLAISMTCGLETRAERKMIKKG